MSKSWDKFADNTEFVEQLRSCIALIHQTVRKSPACRLRKGLNAELEQKPPIYRHAKPGRLRLPGIRTLAALI